MNILFPLIILIIKHVLRDNNYRNTVLVFTPEIIATFLKLSKPLQSDLGHCRSDHINFKSYLSHYKSEEVITPTLKMI